MTCAPQPSPEAVFSGSRKAGIIQASFCRVKCPAPKYFRYTRLALGELLQATARQFQRLIFFTEAEADILRAGGRIFEEAGAGDIGHDVIRALRSSAAETGIGQ